MSNLRDSLTEIAHDPSVGARSKLLSSLSDLVFERRTPTAEEVAALCAVAKLLLKVADEASRCHFATTIAPSSLVPREIVFLLLQDHLVVAGPILRDSPVLTEADLLVFAETLSEDRLVFVAQRHHVSAALVEILVGRDSEIVQLAVTDNEGAELSPKSLQLLIQTAEEDEPLCRSLVRRPEVSKADAERLVQLITKMLMARMRAPIVPPAPVIPETPPPEDISVAPKTLAKFEIADIIAAVKAGRLSADHAIAKLSEDDRFNDLVTLVSTLAHLDDVSVMRLIVRADANGIGMILKALDINDASFDAVLALRKRRLKVSDAQMRYDRENYARLNAGESKATLAQLSGQRKSK